MAPFKAQNMSNNSMVCSDGAEIGRAQYLQAQAARVEPTSAMNPVLLKPGSDRRSFVVLRGQPYGTLEAGQYATGRTALREAAFDGVRRARRDPRPDRRARAPGHPRRSTCGPGDYVNLGLARRFDLPMVVVGDIDRGGVFASLYGTFALLETADQAAIRGYLINKFRGDRRRPGARVGDADRADGTGLPRRAALAARGLAGRRGHPRGRRLAIVDPWRP